MEYTFSRANRGLPCAEFSMGHEAFGHWFTDELGADKARIQQLLMDIDKLQQGELKRLHVPGIEYQLELDADEVEVTHKSLFLGDESDLPEGTELTEEGLLAGCGLDDFLQVLQSWQAFVGG